MRIRLAIPDELDDKQRELALNHALESVTIANQGLIERGRVPMAGKGIRELGVKWRPEPPGDEHFDLATTVVGRRWGDCDDLAPWHAASLRASGRDPRARAFVRRSGPTKWHALVKRGDGSTEDPSVAAGMGHSVSGAGGGAGAPIHRPMTTDPRLCIAVRSSPDLRHWFARIDVPDAGSSDDWSWTSLARNVDPRHAIANAVRTARAVAGDDLEEEDDLRLSALQDLVSGADPYEVAEALQDMAPRDVDVMRVLIDGMQTVGFLDALTKPFAAITRPLRKAVAPAMHLVDKVTPYAVPLFPGLAQVIDPVRAAVETGDPMAVYKSRLMPGARTARDVFEKNPLGRPAFGVMQQAFGNVPGASQWFEAAAPRPGVPSAGNLPANVDVRGIMAMLTGQGGNAPPSAVYERGQVAQPHPGGPSFLRF